jgi:hypothetical protein
MPNLLLECELPDREASTLHRGRLAYEVDVLSITTSDLIALSVRAHMALQRIAREARDGPRAEAAGEMTAALITSGLASGRVALPRPSEPADGPEAAAREMAEIERALAAFSAGEFQIVVDGVLHRTHAELQLNETSRAVFLRLRPLVGG